MARKYLKELREQHKMTMETVANKIGISRQYYHKIESGERQKKMDITLVVALANVFSVSVEYIINNENSL